MPYYKTTGGTFIHSTYPIITDGTRDGHGGHAAEHKYMMESIANEIVDQKLKTIIPELQQEMFSKAYQQFCQDLTFDVTTAVEIAFENGKSIFEDSRTQRVIAERVMNEIKKQMDGKRYSISL